MSWEQQANYDGSQGGWAPQFAEDYSVFNATPGRLINGQRTFVDTSNVQALSPMTHNGQFNGEGDIMADLGLQMHQLSPNPALQMSSAVPSNKPINISTAPQSRQRVRDINRTPQKPKKNLDEPFSAQTATPPNSSNGNRKLAPKLSTMPSDAQVHSSNFESPSMNTNSHQPQLMIHSSASMDPFCYPMSAPASAPLYTNNRMMWDTGVDGIDLDFSTNSPEMFQHTGHRASNSIDWAKSNQIFQEIVSPQKPVEIESEPRKRHRPLASKSSLPTTTVETPISIPPFAFSNTPVSSAPMATDSFIGAVDPGLIYSRPNSGSGSQGDFEGVMLPASHPSTSHTVRTHEPYQHQLREYSRDQEELRRSRSFRESSTGYQMDRGSVSSPARSSSRSSLRRSSSDSRERRNKDRPRSGRMSPVKQLRHPSLTSIPESPIVRPRFRPEVKLAVGANGRATVVVDEPEGSLFGQTSSCVDDNESFYESSTDEELIVIPSRNNSFNLPKHKAPKLSRFENPNEIRRRSTSAGGGFSHSSSQPASVDELSEAETVMDETAGDAASALRQVVRNRRNGQQTGPVAKHHRLYSDATPRASRYSDYSSSSARSPTDVDGSTPSSSRSGTTRCVCNNVDGDSFMIQCESCDNWLHGQCVNIDRRNLPPVYICAFCAQTPNMRGGRMRETAAQRERKYIPSSPLAHKSFKSFR